MDSPNQARRRAQMLSQGRKQSKKFFSVVVMAIVTVVMTLSVWNTIRIGRLSNLTTSSADVDSKLLLLEQTNIKLYSANRTSSNSLLRSVQSFSSSFASSSLSAAMEEERRHHHPQRHEDDSSAAADGFEKPWYDLTIGIITNASTERRFDSLRRLMGSLKDADYAILERCGSRCSVRLHISMDTATMPQVIGYIRRFHWPYGPKTIQRRVRSAGLVAAVSETWYPTSDAEVGLLLEDDIELSPLYYQWIHNALMSASPQQDGRIAGVSLYTPRRVEVSKLGKHHFDSSKLVERMTATTTATAEGGTTRTAGDPTMPYLHQLPCSWGALYYPHHWRIFIDYMSGRLQTMEDYIATSKHPKQDNDAAKSNLLAVIPPNSVTPFWKSSWKKFLIELMYVKGWFMLYPSYPDQVSFSTNHLEVGEHITHNDTDHRAEDYTVPLMQPSDLPQLKSLSHRDDPLAVPPVDTLPVLSLTNVPFAGVDYLSALQLAATLPSKKQADELAPTMGYGYSYWSIVRDDVRTIPIEATQDQLVYDLEQFHPRLIRSGTCKDYHSITNTLLADVDPSAADGVTLLIATYDRLDVLKMQIEYYTRSPVVKAIMVTWHNQRRTPPPSMRINDVIVDFLPQRKDSLNSRFHPTMKLITDAVIIMDDDMKVHLDDVELLYEVWKKHSDNIVGFYPRRLDKKNKYSWDGIDQFDEPYTMMLTKFMILHKRFLEDYSCDQMMTLVLRKVDAEMNCEDIAMNFVVTHGTGKPAPLFVESLHFVGDFGDSKYTTRPGVHGAISQRKEETIIKKDHRAARTECINEFTERLGTSLPSQVYKVHTRMHTSLDMGGDPDENNFPLLKSSEKEVVYDKASSDPNNDTNLKANYNSISSQSDSRVVRLELVKMGNSHKDPSVLDFTSTCAYDDQQGKLFGSTKAWSRVVREFIRTPVATDKISRPEDACDFQYVSNDGNRRKSLKFYWKTHHFPEE